MWKLSLLAPLAVVVLLLSVGTASAQQPKAFVAHLSGSEAVPGPVDTDTTGQALFQLGQADIINYRLVVVNITAVVAAHIHCAPVGAAGPVGVTLFAGSPKTLTGLLADGPITGPDGPPNGCGWETFDDIVDAMRSGDTYVNVHTLANLAGEIRGQIGNPNPVSSRNLKDNFASVEGRDILAHLSTIPIETWNYKAQDTTIRHIGPMAQDFYAAFGVGEDDRHINTVDASGVSLAAIQGLHQIVQEQDVHIMVLEARLETLEQSNGINGAALKGFLVNTPIVVLTLGVLLLGTPGLVLGYRRIRRSNINLLR